MGQLTFSQHKSLAGIVVCFVLMPFLRLCGLLLSLLAIPKQKPRIFSFFFCFMSLLQSGNCGFARLQLRNVQPIYSDTTSLNLSHDLLR